jgi:hypothetical protein
MSKPNLIYFAARGRAELIRLVLVEAGVDYQEHVVGRGTPPVDGRLISRRSRPLARCRSMRCRSGRSRAVCALRRPHRPHPRTRGRNAIEEAQCDELLGAVDDVRLELRKLVTAADDQRPALWVELASATLPRWLGYLDRLLEKNGGGAGFVAGASVTVADLARWYLLEMIQDNGLGGFITRPWSRLRSGSGTGLASPRT